MVAVSLKKKTDQNSVGPPHTYHHPHATPPTDGNTHNINTIPNAPPPPHTKVRLYGDDNPLDAPGFEAKVKLLAEIDAYLRDKDPRVRQVTVSLGATWQVVEILRPDGETYRDVRPLVRLNVSVVVGDGTRQETGSHGFGGREGYQRFIETHAWQGAVDEAVRQALVNLESVPAPAGEMDVVLGAGWLAAATYVAPALYHLGGRVVTPFSAAASDRLRAKPGLCGMAVVGNRVFRVYGYARLQRRVPIFVQAPGDPRVDPAQFNAALVWKGHADALPPDFRATTCSADGSQCVYERPGGCSAATSRAEINRYLADRGM